MCPIDLEDALQYCATLAVAFATALGLPLLKENALFPSEHAVT
jgi:hypothetical protein